MNTFYTYPPPLLSSPFASSTNLHPSIGVILTIALLLLFVRRILIRRAAHEVSTATPENLRRRVSVVVVSGRNYHLPSRPSATATTGRQRDGNLDPETLEQLPKYEAAPPEYSTIFKDGPPLPPEERAELEGNGGSSAAAAERGGGSGGGEVVINVIPELPEQQQTQQTQEVRPNTAPSAPQQQPSLWNRLSGGGRSH
ncbi:hypothetical protein BDD12DRAFT_800855 [Trichophaea hybrida]|nr:hypothetical protein BDD12DRAFT_800855 [Trichophaea hybrida]